MARHDEYLPKAEIERIIAAGSPVMNRSPKLSKNAQKQKALQKLKEEGVVISMKDIPKAPVNDFGITQSVMQYLEVSQTAHEVCERTRF